MPPSVSIVVPNYNHARFLPERLSSIFEQTWQDFEVILLDDASPDPRCREILREWASRPRVSAYLINEHNSGSTFRQWEKGVSRATGKWIWIAESDDRAHPRFLETLLSLGEQSGADIVQCQSRKIDDDGAFLGLHEFDSPQHDGYPRWTSNFTLDGPTMIAKFLAYENVIPNASGLLFRRSRWDAVQGVNQSFHVSGDWDLWVRMMREGSFAFSTEALNDFRWHGQTVRTQKKRTGELECLSIMLTIANKDLGLPRKSPRKRQLLRALFRRFSVNEIKPLAGTEALPMEDFQWGKRWKLIRLFLPRIRIKLPRSWRKKAARSDKQGPSTEAET